MKKLYVIVLIFLSCSPTEILLAKKIKKKSYKTSTEASAATTAQPAIIAIEIVDPNENSTSAKQSKRTIEGSLGYGYNDFEASKPRYEVYRYSQHDIPPYKGEGSQLFESSSNSQVNIQKSVQYSLPTATQHVTASSKLLQPGTTLFSTLSGKGQVGSLSTSLPQVSSLEQSNVPVPVVVLRIYPNQLKDSTIQANLPKSHPFAKSINSLNIQSLLLQYIKTLKNPGSLSQYSVNQELFGENPEPNSQYLAGQGTFGHNQGSSNQYSVNEDSLGQYHGSSNQYSANQPTFVKNNGYSSQYSASHGSLGHNTYSSNQVISTPISTPAKSSQANYQTLNYYNQDNYQNTPKYQNNNGEAQNYMYYQQSFPQPSAQDYTRQTQYQQQQYPDYNSGVTVVEAPIKYQISPYQSENQWRYQTSAIQKPQVPEKPAPTPQPEYYYVQPNTQNSRESDKYYQPQQLEYSKQSAQTAAVPEQQYYTGNDNSQYSEYYQDAGQQYEAKNQKLLTYENYPTNKHTRVVFRSKSGAVRTPEQDQTATKEVKTIKIHVPENVAKVEVQETERPYYAPESTYADETQKNQEQSDDTYQQSDELERAVPQDNYYLPPQVAQQDYYNNEDSASEVFYNYENVNYDDMAKYFEKRGTMPKHFYQSPEEIEDKKEKSTEATKDIISSYEEAAFPSTTALPIKKRVKSKKRIPM